jgi:hypothetical protein
VMKECCVCVEVAHSGSDIICLSREVVLASVVSPAWCWKKKGMHWEAVRSELWWRRLLGCKPARHDRASAVWLPVR